MLTVMAYKWTQQAIGLVLKVMGAREKFHSNIKLCINKLLRCLDTKHIF